MITLNDDQSRAVENMQNFLKDDTHNMFMLQGSAGTGKTTCIQTLVRENLKTPFCLTAPTNKATKVLKEMAQNEGNENVDCRTIYSLLGLRVQKNSDKVTVDSAAESEAGQYQVIVVDEASMVNQNLMGFIRSEAMRGNTKFIFMGDPMQLPPVGEPYSESFGAGQRAELTKVERHDNQILNLALQLRECIKNDTKPKLVADYDEKGGVYTVNWKRFAKNLQVAYTTEEYGHNPSFAKTVAWRNATVADHNNTIRLAMYGDEAERPFMLGERVVACHPIPKLQDPALFDMVTDEEGTIVELDVIQHPMFPDFKVWKMSIEPEFGTSWATSFVIHEDSLRAYNKKLDELASAAHARKQPWSSFWAFKNEWFHDIRPCHAITTHRSQGSTYKNVFVDVQDIMSNLNTSEALRCLYVAVTRASHNVVMQTR